MNSIFGTRSGLVAAFTGRGVIIAVGVALAACRGSAAEAKLWARENLQAWCIVPFDAKKRSPEQRAEMLQRVGLRQYAYDFREEHIPTFDREVEAVRAKGIELTAWWFSNRLDDTAKTILAVIERQKIHPTLWVSGGGGPAKNVTDQVARVTSEATRIRPIAEAARAFGCKVALYNHGGWFGDPENQLAVLEVLRRDGYDNVGLVYNFHHAHEHIRMFPTLWPRIMAHVVAVNVSGLVESGDRTGNKIMYIGEGDQELAMMRIIQESGWLGPVGVLCHRTDVDAEDALRRNIAGVEELARKLGRVSTPRKSADSTSGEDERAHRARGEHD